MVWCLPTAGSSLPPPVLPGYPVLWFCLKERSWREEWTYGTFRLYQVNKDNNRVSFCYEHMLIWNPLQGVCVHQFVELNKGYLLSTYRDFIRTENSCHHFSSTSAPVRCLRRCALQKDRSGLCFGLDSYTIY